MPPPLPRRGQRVGRQLPLDMAEECPLPVRPRRQPGQLQLRAQLRVDAQQRLLQVEPLHARRCRRQRALAERAPPGPPRLAIRPAPRRAQRRHVTPQVLQRHRLRGQRLPLQPPQVIQQQVGIRPLGPRPLIAPQEPVRRLMHRPVRPHDRERPAAAAAPLHRLDAKIPDDKLARHGSPDPPGTSRTSLARQVNSAVTLPEAGSPDVADASRAGRKSPPRGRRPGSARLPQRLVPPRPAG